MEKEHQPDSIATVTIKPDYPPSESYSSEPPPEIPIGSFFRPRRVDSLPSIAYHRSQSSAVQVAKIIAVTVVLVSVVLGSFLLASAYVTANASCRQLEQELELLSDAADRFQANGGAAQLPQADALVQDETVHHKQSAEPSTKVNDVDSNSVDNSESSDSSSDSSSSSSEEEERTPIHFKLPLQLDFDDLAGALIDRNQKSRMNCIVEKKRAEQVVDHQPKTLRLPFGLNLTTDPRYEHLSGERMAIFCESGNVQRNEKARPAEDDTSDDEDDDSSEETIMIQPVMIPIPQTHFPTHMAQQMRPQPSVSIVAQPHVIQAQQQQVQQPTIQFQQIHPMEQMRPPMPPMMAQQQGGQNQLPPNAILHQIAQQIIARKIMEAQQAREEQQNREQAQQDNVIEQRPSFQRYSPMPEGMVPQRIPIPEEILTQLNRLPNREVIVAVSEQEPEEVQPQQQQQQQQEQQHEMQQQEMQGGEQPQQEVRMVPQEIEEVVQRMVPEGMRVIQAQRHSAQEMNGRQAYARGLPVNIPIHMIHQQQEQQVPQEPQAVASEEARPHYVQPRSVRSVDALLPKSQKRVKRCSCDCSC